MVDLCIGPHIPHTGKIKAFMVTKVSRGDRYGVVRLMVVFAELCILLFGGCEKRFPTARIRHLLPGQETIVGLQSIFGRGSETRSP